MAKKGTNAMENCDKAEVTLTDETTVVLDAVKKILENNPFSFELSIQIKITRAGGENTLCIDHLAKDAY